MQIEQKQANGLADFDFLMGNWRAHHRRLRERLKGSQDWEVFEGTSTVRKLLGGLANMDENIMQREAGRMEGVSLRLYDAPAQQWSIYWASSLSGGAMGQPQVGSFKDGVGEFYNWEPFEGRMILTRYIWSGITENACHWEQAFSTDGGKTWETNWIMDFTREEPA
jgi:hypothetical protein